MRALILQRGRNLVVPSPSSSLDLIFWNPGVLRWNVGIVPGVRMCGDIVDESVVAIVEHFRNMAYHLG